MSRSVPGGKKEEQLKPGTESGQERPSVKVQPSGSRAPTFGRGWYHRMTAKDSSSCEVEPARAWASDMKARC